MVGGVLRGFQPQRSAKVYDGLPWFWSDQGPYKLQIAGLTTGYDQVVVAAIPQRERSPPSATSPGNWSASVRQPRRGSHVRAAPAGRQRLVTPEQAVDLGFDLKGALVKSDQLRCRSASIVAPIRQRSGYTVRRKGLRKWGG